MIIDLVKDFYKVSFEKNNITKEEYKKIKKFIRGYEKESVDPDKYLNHQMNSFMDFYSKMYKGSENIKEFRECIKYISEFFIDINNIKEFDEYINFLIIRKQIKDYLYNVNDVFDNKKYFEKFLSDENILLDKKIGLIQSFFDIENIGDAVFLLDNNCLKKTDNENYDITNVIECIKDLNRTEKDIIKKAINFSMDVMVEKKLDFLKNKTEYEANIITKNLTKNSVSQYLNINKIVLNSADIIVLREAVFLEIKNDPSSKNTKILKKKLIRELLLKKNIGEKDLIKVSKKI